MKQKRTKKKSISPALQAYAEERIRQKQTLNKMGTAELYQVAIGHFLKFTGDKEIRIEAISKTMVTDFSALYEHLIFSRLFHVLCKFLLQQTHQVYVLPCLR